MDAKNDLVVVVTVRSSGVGRAVARAFGVRGLRWPQERDILFETMAGDPGAHGPYRDRQRGPDLQMRLRRHMTPAALLAAVALLGTVGWFRRPRTAV